jgi:excinuclease ABC subunit A
LNKKQYLKIPVQQIDGKEYRIEEALELSLEKKVKHTIEVIVDRLKVSQKDKARIADSVEIAVKLSDGLITVLDYDTKEEETYSTKGACPICGFSFKEISPRLFSFNSPLGACPSCGGLGFRMKVDENLLIDWDRPVLGAIELTEKAKFEYLKDLLLTGCEIFGISPYAKFSELSKSERNFLLFSEKTNMRVFNTVPYSRGNYRPYYFEGIVRHLERCYVESESDYVKELIEPYLVEAECETCKGKRLNQEALSVKIEGFN